MKSIKSMKQSIILTGILIVLAPCLYFLSRYNYNLFHIVIEFFTVLLGILIFTITIISRKYNSHSFIERLGYGMLAVAVIVFLHTITYKGMNIVSGYDANLPTQLWISLNYIQSISILTAIILLKIKLKSWIFIAAYTLSALVLIYLCFARIFPDCFIEGKGLTPFKIISEYIIISIYLVSLILLFTKRRKEIRQQYKGFSFALIALILAEFMFTLYSDVFGIQNFLGHYIRLIGLLIIYLNIVLVNIQEPFNTMFRDLKKSEMNLIKSEKKFRLLFEDAPIGYQSLNIEGRLIGVNEAWLKLFKVERDEVIGKWLGDFMTEDSRVEFKKNFRLFADSGIACDGVYEMLTKTKEVLLINITGKIIYDDEGNFKKTQCILQSITAQVKAEKKLIESERRFIAAQKMAHVGNWELTLDTNKIWGSQEAFNIYGIEYDSPYLDLELIQNGVLPEYRKSLDKALEALVTKNVNYDEVFEIKKSDTGELCFVHSIAMLEVDKNDKAVKVVGTLQDITKQKKGEEEITKFRTISDKALHGNVICDLDGIIIYINDFSAQIHGYTYEELIGQHFSVFHNETQLEGVEQISEVLQKDGFFTSTELWHVHKDGTEFPMLMNGNIIADKNGIPKNVTIMSVDITESKRLEEEKAKLDAHLNQQQRLESIGTLAGGVAHEINNPINGIMNYGQLIKDIPEINSQASEYANEIINESDRISTIVKNLLHFSREGKQEHSYSMIEDIINNTTSLIKTIIKHDQIDLVVDISKDLPMIKCRSQQIQQVIMNLLTNARDTLNEKYPGYNEDKIIKLYFEQFDKGKRKWIRITVEDHGMGISKSIQATIFSPFFSTKERDKGTGLGLSISHGIVKDHHGEITYETEEGLYTKFYLDLPIDNEWELE
jgi:PAS domain S-box-containing protein